MIDLSKNIKQLRIDKGVEKSRLLTYLGVTARTYDRYEDGTRKPDIETLLKIADYYDCSLDYLVRKESDDTLVDRSLVVSYRDLKEIGLNDKLSHGLLKQVYSRYSAENIPKVSFDKKIKFVYKEDLSSLLETIKEEMV